MKYTKKILFTITIFAFLDACSTKKDTIVTRNYHSITSKFNILFNGKEALQKGVEELNSGYKDDWFVRLPIEPIKFDEDKIVVPKISSGMGAGFGRSKEQEEAEKPSTPFEIAEDKAAKSIQKHGMNIDGIERNSQIDDAYLLLGKSRYYSQRFIPAIEAFNYVIAEYPNANLIAETKIWRAKTNVRLDNEEFALESLDLLLNVTDTLEANLPDAMKELAHTTLAMAYEKAENLQKVKKHLALAARTEENENQSARNLFILGQIYSEENKKDSASTVFNKLAGRKKAPYKYRIHANIELAKNSTSDATSNVILEKLNKLIENRDNKPYLDGLYYQVGFINESKDSTETAINYYNKSLRTDGGVKQKTYTYERLGNIYFKDSQYILANSYYDSVLQIATETLDLRIRRIKRKHKNLASLIEYENLIVENDSILKLVALTKEEQTEFFQKYIDRIKKKDEEDAQRKLNQLAFGDAFGGNSLQSNANKGKWYFYNSQSLSFGKAEFKKTWGNRQLADGWRWSSKVINNNTKEIDSVQTNKANPRYELETYLSKIPTEKTTIDTLRLHRNEALYELGIIYKEQFKNPSFAVKRLERVATLNKEDKLILPINWHLYQAYTTLENTEKANSYKEVILTQYPDTVFAQRILNPDKAVSNVVKASEIEKTYKEIYYLYKEDLFEETITKIDKVLPTIQNSELIPKFELLKAYAIGKYKENETYKTALEFVAINYGNTEEGKKAKQIMQQLTKK